MGNVVRIGDKVSCGDRSARGAATVFCNGIPISTQSANRTTGHPGGRPTTFAGPFSSTVFVEGAPVVLKDLTKIIPHNKKSVGTGHSGVASSGSPDVSIEG